MSNTIEAAAVPSGAIGAMASVIADIVRRMVVPIRPGAFRLFLAMLVFVHHFSSLDLGPYAVYVFFTLSGYWVQKMWTERYSRTKNPYVTYLISRLWRLSPTMVLVSILTIFFLLMIGTPGEKLGSNNPLHLFFSSTFLIGYSFLDYLPIGSAWSLDAEMQYYLAAPALAWMAARTRASTFLIVALFIGGLFAFYAREIFVAPKYLTFLPVDCLRHGGIGAHLKRFSVSQPPLRFCWF